MERAREHTRERPKAIENRNIKTGKGGPKRKEKEARAYKSSRGVVGGMVVFKYLASKDGHARKGAYRGPYHTHTHIGGASWRPRKGIVRSAQQA